MKRFADMQWRDVPVYKVGDKVWLETKNLKINQPNKKLTEKRIGPFEVTQIVSANAVKLKLPVAFQLHPVFNVDLIHPYQPPVHGQVVLAPDPVEFDDGEEYEVESVLDSHVHHKELQYLVKWKGFTDNHNEWLDTKSNIGHMRDLVANFHVKFPNAE